MAHSLANVILNIVFSTKFRVYIIVDETHLWDCMWADTHGCSVGWHEPSRWDEQRCV